MRTHTPRHHIEKKAIDIDWGARDIELAVAVRRSAARLMNAPGRPVWISADAIGRDTGKRHRALSRDDRLPLTNQALIEVIESREDWAIRRIRWAVECYRQEGVCATERDVLAYLEAEGVEKGHITKWMLPDFVAITDEIPKTSVGKFDKRAIKHRLDDFLSTAKNMRGG